MRFQDLARTIAIALPESQMFSSKLEQDAHARPNCLKPSRNRSCHEMLGRHTLALSNYRFVIVDAYGASVRRLDFQSDCRRADKFPN